MSLCVNIIEVGFVAKITVDAMNAFVVVYEIKRFGWIILSESVDECFEFVELFFLWCVNWDCFIG